MKRSAYSGQVILQIHAVILQIKVVILQIQKRLGVVHFDSLRFPYEWNYTIFLLSKHTILFYIIFFLYCRKMITIVVVSVDLGPVAVSMCTTSIGTRKRRGRPGGSLVWE